MYIESYGKGYATKIAQTFGMSLSQVQNQLRKFEELGLLVSRKQATRTTLRHTYQAIRHNDDRITASRLKLA